MNQYSKEVLLTLFWLAFIFMLSFLLIEWAKSPSEDERMAAKGYSNVCIEMPGGRHAWHWMLTNSTEYTQLMHKYAVKD